MQPVVDPFTHEIYYLEDWTGNIMKIKPDGSGNNLTVFPTLPTFSQKEHKAFYLEFIPTISSNLIQYDFNTGDTTLLIIGLNRFALSPSEERILITTFAPKYYSFLDSSVHDPGIRLNAEKIEFIDDSTLIYIDSDRERILKYSYYNNSIDTLITTTISEGIVDIDCNPDSNIFVYSHFFNNGDDIGINLFRVPTQIDSMIFDFNQDDPQLAGLIILLDDLEWSSQYDKLAFIGNVLSPHVGEIYVYDTNTDTTIRFTEFGVTDEVSKADLVWLNEDTIIYGGNKYMQLSQIYGFDISPPLFINQSSKIRHNLFLLSNFPNPFNPTTNISFDIPYLSNVNLVIYDITGRQIRTLTSSRYPAGSHSLQWDGKDGQGNAVASGIYVYRIVADSQGDAGNYIQSRKMMLLK